MTRLDETDLRLDLSLMFFGGRMGKRQVIGVFIVGVACILMAGAVSALFVRRAPAGVVFYNKDFDLLAAEYRVGDQKVLLVDDHSPWKNQVARVLRKFRSSKWARRQAYSLNRDRSSDGWCDRPAFWLYYSGELPDAALTNVYATLVDDRGKVLELQKRAWMTYRPTREYGSMWFMENFTPNTNAHYIVRLSHGSNGHPLADLKVGKLQRISRKRAK